MRYDFYQLTRDPAAQLAVTIVSKILAGGGRALVAAAEESLLREISELLWSARPTSFLAHGLASDPDIDASVQPILLSHDVDPANSADHVILADGQWREPPPGVERLFYLFSSAEIDDARNAWRALKERDNCTRHFWEQLDGQWIERG